MVWRICESIKSHNELYNLNDYKITSIVRGCFKVDIDSSMVYVTDLHSGRPVPLEESDLYRRVIDK